MASNEEVLVPLATPASRIPPATHVRGSVVLASMRGLRARGLYDRYAAALDADLRDTVLGLTAGTWHPVDLAVRHYAACDRLGLDEALIAQLGAESGAFLNASVVSVLLRFTRELGGTPWGAIVHIERLRERLWQGGAFTVVKLGPKEARIEWYGQPCARWPYYRLAFGAFMAGILRPLSLTVQVRPLTRQCTDTTLAYALSWV